MTSKKQLILTSVIFGLVAVVLVFIILKPLRAKLEKASGEYALAKKDLGTIENRREDLKKAQEDYKGVEKDLDSVRQFFVDPAAPLELLRFLEERASHSNLSIAISPYNFKEDEKADFWETIGLQLSLSGSFSGFLAFLEELENSFYLIEVQSLSVDKLSEKSIRGEDKEIPADAVRSNLVIRILTR
mgnify:CR=1 FL=1